jgi:DNA-binding transcriptional ArsR family regulator
VPRRTKDSALDRLVGALANPTRRDILDALLDGEQTVTELAARFDMARPSVSEHLAALRDGGLVDERTSGRHRYYTVTAGPLRELADWLSPYERFWRGRMRDLGRVLDELPDLPADQPHDDPHGRPHSHPDGHPHDHEGRR